MPISLTAITSTLSTAAKVLKEMDKLELYEQVTNARTQLFDLNNELMDKNARIRQLEESLAIQPRLVFNRCAYYEWLSEKGAYSKDAYCSHCWEAEHLAIHLNLRWHEKKAVCPRCKGYIDHDLYGDVPDSYSKSE